MKSWLALLLIMSASIGTAAAQNPVKGAAVNRPTTNGSATITSGNAFQTILAALAGTTVRQSLTIQNNNTNGDSCWIHVGTGTPTTGTSILLLTGQAYTRYFPYVPSDAIQATCATTSDVIYVDTQ